MIALIGLGFTLSLDNFRTSVALGGLKPTWVQSVKTSLIFAIWDGLAPAAGILIGEYLTAKIGGVAAWIGAVVLAGYGLWIIVKAVRSPEPADLEMKTARRWLPIPLSLDNIAAGTTIGLAGYDPWLAPALFAATTFVMSIAGHRLGTTVANFIPRLRTDLLTGIVIVAMAGLTITGLSMGFGLDVVGDD